MTDFKLGLTDEEVKIRRETYGKNTLGEQKKTNFLIKLVHIILEPMFLLLIVASLIYFILGEPRDGMVMLVFVTVMIAIDVIQERKTDKTLEALKELSAPTVMVLRNGKKIELSSEEIVPGDIVYIYEGFKIPADGEIIKCSGLRIDESTLTGESQVVYKKEKEETIENYFKENCVYAGTLVVGGTGTILITQIGKETEYGKIGKTVVEFQEEKTPLQKQTDRIVKVCAWIAFLLFLLVTMITFFRLTDNPLKTRIVESILSGITLAMAMIPEEFPVVFTVFLSLGAWRLARKQSLVKKLPSVETLGSVSVLCVDKTGTITQNQMQVASIEPILSDKEELIETMGLSCEEDVYDPMETAMINYCEQSGIPTSHLYGGEKLKGYPFSSETKMAGASWFHDEEWMLTVKGSYESIISLCDLTEEEKKTVSEKADMLADKGERVIAIGKRVYQNKEEIPEDIHQSTLKLCGLVGLIDPPRDHMKENIQICKDAHVRVMMITGDYGKTAHAIAHQIGLEHSDEILTGIEIDNLTDEDLKEKLKSVNIFSRVLPKHKLRIVQLLKEMGEVVAMTGDGVNDAPALKCADIGIAMGKRGTTVTREAADLILMDDNFETIVTTIQDGRRIFDNMRKAFGYIFVIHIPIALSSLFGPLLGIMPNQLLLLPLHVVLLELLIDPTCSVVLERQPAEEDIMKRKPRDIHDSMIPLSFLMRSLIQGVVLFLASFGTYYYFLNTNTAVLARSLGLLVIVLGNLFLVQVNSSESRYAYTTLKKLKHDKVIWGIHLLTLFMVIVIFCTPCAPFFKLTQLSITQLLLGIFISFISVYWFELVKLYYKKRNS
ncbi:MAG: cation-translocating P-type ATPase [Firmicutes bacterium]|nr:cation-translocating P-type ATPase [Bacillota bacterium]